MDHAFLALTASGIALLLCRLSLRWHCAKQLMAKEQWIELFVAKKARRAGDQGTCKASDLRDCRSACGEDKAKEKRKQVRTYL